MEVRDTLRGIEIRAALSRILAILFGLVLLGTGAISFQVLSAKRSRRGELPA